MQLLIVLSIKKPKNKNNFKNIEKNFDLLRFLTKFFFHLEIEEAALEEATLKFDLELPEEKLLAFEETPELMKELLFPPATVEPPSLKIEEFFCGASPLVLLPPTPETATELETELFPPVIELLAPTALLLPAKEDLLTKADEQTVGLLRLPPMEVEFEVFFVVDPEKEAACAEPSPRLEPPLFSSLIEKPAVCFVDFLLALFLPVLLLLRDCFRLQQMTKITRAITIKRREPATMMGMKGRLSLLLRAPNSWSKKPPSLYSS